jgi:RHS repeat-associated protein
MFEITPHQSAVATGAVLFGSNRSNFLYDATGRKLRKTVTGNGQTEQRDYLDGIEYKDGKPDQFLHSEGTVRADEKGQFRYYFVLRDHLGNTRVTFSDFNNDDKVSEKEEILQINNYYAFGLNMEGNWNGKDGANKYQYNEKEWNDDFGLGWNDYGTRFYDPAMARFQTIDIMADDYSVQTPYAYAANNPIRYRDFMGMNPTEQTPTVDLGEVLVTATRTTKKDPPISDDFRFQNLYDQLVRRIEEIRKNQMPQNLNLGFNGGFSVSNNSNQPITLVGSHLKVTEGDFVNKWEETPRTFVLQPGKRLETTYKRSKITENGKDRWVWDYNGHVVDIASGIPDVPEVVTGIYDTDGITIQAGQIFEHAGETYDETTQTIRGSAFNIKFRSPNIDGIPQELYHVQPNVRGQNLGNVNIINRANGHLQITLTGVWFHKPTIIYGQH